MATSPRAEQGILNPIRRVAPAVFGRPGKSAPRLNWKNLVAAPQAAAWDIVLGEEFPEVSTVHWRGPAGEVGEGPLDTLPIAARKASLRVWTPAVETLLTSVTWPSRSRAKLAQALPFLLEEQLLMEPERLNFSHQDTAAGVMVAVTAGERLEAWRSAFADLDLKAMFCPLSLGLPFADGQWSCRFANGQWAVRTGPYSGFGAAGRATAPPPSLLQTLSEALARNAGPSEIHLYDGDETVRSMLERTLKMAVVLDGRPVGAVETMPFRLGETKGAIAASGLTALRSLRPALWIAAFGLFLGFAHMMYQWVHLGQVQARLEGAQTRLFTRNFPGMPVLDPARQMRMEVKKLATQGGGEGGFLGLLARAAPALKGLGNGALSELHYDSGRLWAEVQVANFAALTGVEGALGRAGLKVQARHVVSRKKGVRARLVIKGAS